MKRKLKVGISVSSFGVADASPVELLKAEGFEIKPNPYGRRLTEEEIGEFIQGVDGIISGLEPLNRKVLSQNPHLKAIARVGIGIDNVDLQAAEEFNIKVSNTPDGPTEAVAEAVLTYLLALLRRVPEIDRDMHKGVWVKKLCKSIHGLRVTIIGFGRIGRRVAQLLSDLGAIISVVDPYLSDSGMLPYPVVSLADGLVSAEAISIHASGTDTILGEHEFSLIKNGCYLLNAARGSLVCEKSLIRSLNSETLAGVWFDTFWKEPYQGPLIGHSKAILSPHLATFTDQCRFSMETQAARNLISDLSSTLHYDL